MAKCSPFSQLLSPFVVDEELFARSQAHCVKMCKREHFRTVRSTPSGRLVPRSEVFSYLLRLSGYFRNDTCFCYRLSKLLRFGDQQQNAKHGAEPISEHSFVATTSDQFHDTDSIFALAHAVNHVAKIRDCDCTLLPRSEMCGQAI